MGVGGLLSEIPTRPQPRDDRQPRPRMPRASPPSVLAAGLSSRMGHNKLLADVGGKPLVRRVVEAALASGACKPVIVVVTGNDAERCRSQALAGLPVAIVRESGLRERV